MIIKGATITKMHKRAVTIAFKAGFIRLHLIRKVLPTKKAMKIDSRTPVDLVSVLAPKKKHPNKAACTFGIMKERLFCTIGSAE